MRRETAHAKLKILSKQFGTHGTCVHRTYAVQAGYRHG
jgi:hypothetical protein